MAKYFDVSLHSEIVLHIIDVFVVCLCVFIFVRCSKTAAKRTFQRRDDYFGLLLARFSVSGCSFLGCMYFVLPFFGFVMLTLNRVSLFSWHESEYCQRSATQTMTFNRTSYAQAHMRT